MYLFLVCLCFTFLSENLLISPEIWCKTYVSFEIISKLTNPISDCVHSERNCWTIPSGGLGQLHQKFTAVIEIFVRIFLTKSSVVLADAVARQKISSRLSTPLYWGINRKKSFLFGCSLFFQLKFSFCLVLRREFEFSSTLISKAANYPHKEKVRDM